MAARCPEFPIPVAKVNTLSRVKGFCRMLRGDYLYDILLDKMRNHPLNEHPLERRSLIFHRFMTRSNSHFIVEGSHTFDVFPHLPGEHNFRGCRL